MFARQSRLVLAVAAALLVAGCAQPSPVQRLPELSFAHLQAYRLDVGQLEIANQYTATGQPPHVEHLMPVSPAQAAQRWAQDRLQPIGREGTARFVIEQASVTEEILPTDRGVTGLFKREQEARYDANLRVSLQILDNRRMPVAEITAQASRSRTVPQGLTLNERDKIWYEMVENLTSDLNARLEVLMGQYMARWIQ
ncbi:hypothetical protein [Telmatospirillum sp. J64-1]|uniref:hypothetical protein n=1 Tax=Telmatospirillum sp. J64-1 TaxID=2502183 RepID=UPI00115F3762|nr:hypothetical protein [Telmatospirillum sp. J64-1]